MCTRWLTPPFSPFRPISCFLPAEPLRSPWSEGLQHTGGKGVAVSLGTPTNRHSQIRIPTCSGWLHYFSLLNSQVTQEQGVDPSLTFRTNSCRETGTKWEAARSPAKPCATRCWLLNTAPGTFIHLLAPSCRLKQGLGLCWDVVCWLPRGAASSQPHKSLTPAAHSTELSS